jgi:MSHA pilin protein MshD
MKKVKNYKLKVRTFLKKLFTRNFSPLTNLKGFTLIEIVLIIIIASIAIPTLLLLLGQQAKSGADAEIRVTAANVAQKFMEEIITKKWDENVPIPPNAYTTPPAPEAGETRTTCTETPSTYDDVDDYNGYSESCTWGGISFTTDVAVCYVDPADLTTCVGLSSYKRITVTVSNANISPVEIVTLMTNY